MDLAQLRISIVRLDCEDKIFDPDLTLRAVDLAQQLLTSDPSSQLYRETLAEALEPISNTESSIRVEAKDAHQHLPKWHI